MLKKLLGLVAVALGVLAVVVATRPDTYHVERSARIDAPPAAVFAVVSDFKSFPEWSPWAKRDPAMKTTLSTPSSGVGATYAWEGNSEVGKGRMTFTESQPPARLREKLEFLEPMASVADVTYDIKPIGGASASSVTWSMDGKANFIGKAFTLVKDMDEMIGKDFDDGLTNLKRVVEERLAAAAAAVPAGEAPPAEAAPPAPAAPPPPKKH